jgi:hypothetical protein
MYEIELLVLLGFVGMAAGFVDAVAGGGGLIALPVLLSVGVPPVAAMATNKMQSIIGTAVASYTYWRKGFLNLKTIIPAIGATFSGSYLGANIIKRIDVSALMLVVPIALILIAAYFLFAPNLSDENKKARLNFIYFAPVLGFAIGFYDGIFGPGTGSFFAIGFVTLFGFGVLKATAHAKVLNFTSNIAALALFIPAGDVVWPIALVMMVGQIIGARLGALSGIKFGAKFIKPLVVVICVAMAVKLLLG